jgi:transcriptional repressor NrdR
MSLFKCPKCGSGKVQVKDTRISKKNGTIRRRRQCSACKFRLSTIETIVADCLAGVKKRVVA